MILRLILIVITVSTTALKFSVECPILGDSTL